MSGLLDRIKALFWHPDENRLRAPLRIILFITIVFGTLTLVTFIPPVGDFTNTVDLTTGIGIVVTLVLSLIAYGVGIPVASRFLDRRPIENYGLHIDSTWLREYRVGFALGGALITIALAFQFAFGWITISGTFTNNTSYPFLLISLVYILLSIAVYVAQIVFRIIILKNTAEGLNGYLNTNHAVIIAIIVAIVVRLLFYTSSGTGSTYTIFVEILIHLITLIAYVYTANASFAAGFGTGWTLFATFVYGTRTSTATAPASLVNIESTGPVAITGGQFGIDGGLAGLITVVFGLFVLFGWLRYTDNLTLPEEIYTRVDRTDESD